jgi:hypothetical protein
MAEKEVRRTTAKKAVRKTAATSTPARTTVRRSSASSVRKAPTQAQVSVSSPAVRKALNKGFLLGLILFVVLIGVSALIGYSDKGQLDVASTISSRIQNATPEEQETFKTVPVQQGQTENSAPNGGLVGMGQPDIPPPAVENESTSTEEAAATSTDATAATSTPEVTTNTEVESQVQGEVTTEAQ